MKSIQPYLTYAGASPFVISAVLLASRHAWFASNYFTDAVMQLVVDCLCVYCLIIASFIAGSHWGLILNIQRDAVKLAVVSPKSAY